MGPGSISLNSQNRTSNMSNGVSWEHDSPFLDVDYEERCPLGTPSLKHLAMKQALRDQRSLSQSHFSCVPWIIAKELWDYLSRSGKRTLHMWKIFCACYPNEFRQVLPFFRIAVDEPHFQMRDYLNLVNSTDCDWATQLVIGTEYAFIPELVEVSNVANLVSLEMFTGKSVPYLTNDVNQAVSTVDDRVIRSWTELIDSSGAFRHLRILKLYKQPHITAASFHFFTEFPSLEYCIVAMCDGLTSESAIQVAEEHGWQICQDKPVGAVYDFSHELLNLWKSWRKKVPDGLIPSSLPKDIPVLEFVVGLKQERLVASSSSVHVFRRDPTKTRERSKRKFEEQMPARGDRKQKKPTVKDRGRDLSGVLGEFM